jgi:hypothetical protein
VVVLISVDFEVVDCCRRAVLPIDVEVRSRFSSFTFRSSESAIGDQTIGLSSLVFAVAFVVEMDFGGGVIGALVVEEAAAAVCCGCNGLDICLANFPFPAVVVVVVVGAYVVVAAAAAAAAV